MRYRTIVADPPWPHKDSGAHNGLGNRPNAKGARSIVPYERLSVADIRALPVTFLAERDAHLYLWTTNRFIQDAFAVIDAWGFSYSTTLVWCKAPRGISLGGAFTITTEFLLFARRGRLAGKTRLDSTWFQWKRPFNGSVPAHSQKPEGALDIVETVSPGPYLELFARRQRLGWDTWGDEALAHVELTA